VGLKRLLTQRSIAWRRARALWKPPGDGRRKAHSLSWRTEPLWHFHRRDPVSRVLLAKRDPEATAVSDVMTEEVTTLTGEFAWGTRRSSA
jgi:hypothetical protein